MKLEVWLKNRGFTLIELLVVISIIAVLSGVILNTLNGVRSKARDAKRMEDLKQIELALKEYYDDNGKYPESSDGLCRGTPIWWQGCNPKYYLHSNGSYWQSSLGGALINYFPNGISVDPKNEGDFIYTYMYDENGFYGAGCKNKFFIATRLESGLTKGSCSRGVYYSVVLGDKDW